MAWNSLEEKIPLHPAGIVKKTFILEAEGFRFRGASGDTYPTPSQPISSLLGGKGEGR